MNSTCPSERFGEIVLEKPLITFTVSRLWAKNIRTSRKSFQQVYQNCFQHLRWTVLRFFFEKFTRSLSLLHYEQKNKTTFEGNLSVWLLKWYESWGTFWWETIFLGKLKLFFSTSTLWAKFFRTLGRKIQARSLEPLFKCTANALTSFFVK